MATVGAAMNLGLEGKVAMVAGASRGLGLAVARALAAEGARVSIASRGRDAIEAAAADLRAATGGDILAAEADVRSAEAIGRWRDATVARWGRIDCLYSNSGGPPPGTFADLDDAAWRDAFDLLLLSAARLVRAVMPSMRERGGSIVLSTSSSVKEPIPVLVLSNVMRAAVASLAKTLAGELAPQRIRVNHLLPGRIATDRLRELDALSARRAGISVEEQERRAAAAIPLGRYGAPEEFAKAAVFLLSDAAAYVTGASLQVDGGLIRSVL